VGEATHCEQLVELSGDVVGLRVEVKVLSTALVAAGSLEENIKARDNHRDLGHSETAGSVLKRPASSPKRGCANVPCRRIPLLAWFAFFNNS